MKQHLVALVLLMTGCGGPTAAECAASTDTYANYGQSLVATNCRSCHEHANQFSTQASIQSSLSTIESEVSTGRMPENTNLSASDKARLLLWLGCGAQ